MTDGETETSRPEATACATRSKRSSRLSGSPPVKMRCGFGGGTAAIRSMTRTASAVSSSPGARQGWASARQWRQARSQALVVSQ